MHDYSLWRTLLVCVLLTLSCTRRTELARRDETSASLLEGGAPFALLEALAARPEPGVLQVQGDEVVIQTLPSDIHESGKRDFVVRTRGEQLTLTTHDSNGDGWVDRVTAHVRLADSSLSRSLVDTNLDGRFDMRSTTRIERTSGPLVRKTRVWEQLVPGDGGSEQWRPQRESETFQAPTNP
ncbi:hypothetical protein F0U61_42870 [Archangium violaceum]|uniref:hypothetical protein n=1 Tax=Archangium violaceum TaxID=83451 RepID=UPI002B313C2C|nr:hypothetical protein F0U61_42870 [Archangium violaceum]